MLEFTDRYFDQLSISCTGCRFFATDEYPDGTPYKACRYFGYIFHEDKGVSSELCEAKRTDCDEIKSTPKNLKELKKMMIK